MNKHKYHDSQQVLLLRPHVRKSRTSATHIAYPQKDNFLTHPSSKQATPRNAATPSKAQSRQFRGRVPSIDGSGRSKRRACAAGACDRSRRSRRAETGRRSPLPRLMMPSRRRESTPGIEIEDKKEEEAESSISREKRLCFDLI